MLIECMEYYKGNIWIVCKLIKVFLDQIVEELNVYFKKYLVRWGGNLMMLILCLEMKM